jgi:hypothetical protein
MIADTSKTLQFWVHKTLTGQTFYKPGLMSPIQFQEVAWKEVYGALHNMPRMFQIWVAKVVTTIAGANENQAVYNKEYDPRCPSCGAGDGAKNEVCRHMLYCEEEGHVTIMNCTIGLLNN